VETLSTDLFRQPKSQATSHKAQVTSHKSQVTSHKAQHYPSILCYCFSTLSPPPSLHGVACSSVFDRVILNGGVFLRSGVAPVSIASATKKATPT
jgi:hypothetical protein